MAIAALSACGDAGRGVDDFASPGECTADADTGPRGPYAHGGGNLAAIAAVDWFAVGTISDVRPAPRREGYGPDDYLPPEVMAYVEGTSSTGAPVARHEVRTERRVVDEWQRKAADTTMWAPVGDHIVFGVETLADGSVRFVGVCRDTTHGRGFTTFVTAMRAKGDHRSPADLFRAIVANRSGPEAAALRRPSATGPTPWGARSAGQRQYGPDTPSEILARTPVRNLTITAPRTWSGFPGTVCFKSPTAWGGCAAFAAIATGAPSEVTTHYDGQSPVEVWLLNESGDFAKPVVKLGTLTPQQMGGTSLHLVGDAGIATFEQLVSEARRRPVVTAKPG